MTMQPLLPAPSAEKLRAPRQQMDTWNGLAKKLHGDCPRGTLSLTKTVFFSGPHRNIDSRVPFQGTAQRATALEHPILGLSSEEGYSLGQPWFSWLGEDFFFFFCDESTSLHME